MGAKLLKKKYHVAIIEDDESSRLVLENYVSLISFLELKASISSANDGLSFLINNKNIDILIMDINMPDLSGLDILKRVNNPPKTILVTGDDKFAVGAFELQVTDYIVKPMYFDRFSKAIHRAVDQIYFERSTSRFDDTKEIYIKSNGRLLKLDYDIILYVEALADYVLVHTEDGSKHIVYNTMKAVEDKLTGSVFKRVHRSYMVNTKKIMAIHDNSVVINNKYLPISKTYAGEFFGNLNLL
jgi:DNA-binding LytR/AlgR family response regulator